MPFRPERHGTLPRLALALGLLWFLPSDAPQADQGHTHDQRLKGQERLSAHEAYSKHCAACHGTKGDGAGNRSAPNFTTPAAVVTYDRDRMILAGLLGHQVQVRAAWSDTLDAPDIAQVIDYMREAFMLPAPLADASLGRKIYARSCSVCHGERGDGASWAQNSLDPPPRNFTAAESRKLTRRDMINAVTYGSPGTAMMPFTTRFADEEIAAVVDYIRQTFQSNDSLPAQQGHGGAGMVALGSAGPGAHQDHGLEGGAGMDAAFPDNLAGRAEQGHNFYEKNCAECHGMKGDGQGPRAYFMTRKPRDFTSDKARAELNRPHLFEAISKGVLRSEMAAWSKVLNGQQIADVAEYVFDAFIQPSQDGHPSVATEDSKKN